MAALLTVFGDKEDKVRNYIQEGKRMGVKVHPPDINLSGLGFNMEGQDALRFGLLSIKGLGDAAIDHIFEARPFSSLEDLITRVPKKNLNKKSLESLAFSGALDKLANDDNRMNIMFTIHKIRGDKKVDLTEEVAKFDHKAKLEKEKELLSLFIGGHPLDGIAEPINWDYIPNGTKFDAAGVITSFKELETKKGDKMAFVNIDTLEGNKRIVLFPQTYQTVEGQLVKDLVIKVNLLKKHDFMRDETSFITNKITIPKRINKDILATLPPRTPKEDELVINDNYGNDYKINSYGTATPW